MIAVIKGDNVDGRNPAPAEVNYPLFTRFYTSQVVQDCTEKYQKQE